jgi:hypothetical protein
MAFYLPSIQGLPVLGPGDALQAELRGGLPGSSDVPFLSSTLVLMGGVGVESCWLNDIHILTVSRSGYFIFDTLFSVSQLKVLQLLLSYTGSLGLTCMKSLCEILVEIV